MDKPIILSRWILISEVPLDEKNGAGMRAILPYLQALNNVQLFSLFLSLQNYKGQDLKTVQYIKISYRNKFGFRLFSIFFGTFYSLLLGFSRNDQFLILPNSIKDLIMGLACRLYSPHTLVWIMDDFIEAYAYKSKVMYWIYKNLFKLLYITAEKRIVVSQAMSQKYEQIYHKKADGVFGRTLQEVLPPKPCSHQHLKIEAIEIENIKNIKKTQLRLVYVGSFLNLYSDPLFVIQDILLHPPAEISDIEITVDLFGILPPPTDWLIPNKINYLGSIPSHPPRKLLEILASYDFGLIPYSFSKDTIRIMSCSFPSKLIDYLGASLPSLIIAPSELLFLSEIQKKEIGLHIDTLSKEAICQGILKLVNISHEIYEKWQYNAYQWAKDEFQFDSSKLTLL